MGENTANSTLKWKARMDLCTHGPNELNERQTQSQGFSDAHGKWPWGQGGGSTQLGRAGPAPTPIPATLCPVLLSHGQGRPVCPDSRARGEEGKPRGQNRDALGQSLCPAKPQPPQRRAWRPHLGADGRGINQAFGAGPTASTDAAATDSGQDPQNTPRPLGTPVFSSKTRGKRSPRGEACMSTGLAHPPARQLPTACSAGPAWGGWTGAGSSSGHRRLSPQSLQISTREATDQQEVYLQTLHGGY